jgi:ankyrin repeat protein
VASMSGHVAVARVLLENGADADARKTDKRTPLHLARNEGVARVLLEYGADPTARDDDDQTPLAYARQEDRTDVARVLLENGVDA